MIQISLQEAILAVRSLHVECCAPPKEEIIVNHWIDHSRRVYKTERWSEEFIDVGGEG